MGSCSTKHQSLLSRLWFARPHYPFGSLPLSHAGLHIIRKESGWNLTILPSHHLTLSFSPSNFRADLWGLLYGCETEPEPPGFCHVPMGVSRWFARVWVINDVGWLFFLLLRLTKHRSKSCFKSKRQQRKLRRHQLTTPFFVQNCVQRAPAL